MKFFYIVSILIVYKEFMILLKIKEKYEVINIVILYYKYQLNNILNKIKKKNERIPSFRRGVRKY